MSFNFLYFKLIIKGLPDELDRLWSEFADEGFSLQKICPVPAELDFENTNLVQTGFAALFGDWESVSRQWMLKEAATKNGYPFPLETREQVVKCLSEVDKDNLYLKPALTFKDNLESHGFGSREEWRKKYWGIPDEVSVSLFERRSDCIELRFAASALPRAALKSLSKKFPGVTFGIDFQSESGKRSGRLTLTAGKETKN